jgi:hypothetical protein
MVSITAMRDPDNIGYHMITIQIGNETIAALLDIDQLRSLSIHLMLQNSELISYIENME